MALATILVEDGLRLTIRALSRLAFSSMPGRSGRSTTIG